jgi:hypothetical protein
MEKTNPVVHFEMPYDNDVRVAKFYSEVFGWSMEKTGDEMGNYIVAMTTKTDENKMVEVPGTINGGFFPKKMMDMSAQHPSVVISVEDIKGAMAMVINAGGIVHGEPMDIPKIGKYVSFTDTEGNRVSILQPMKM